MGLRGTARCVLFSARSNILCQALGDVGAWAVKRESEPQAQCVRLVADVDRQMVDMTCGDMMHSLTISMPAEVAANGCVSLMAKDAASMTKALPPAADVRVEANDRHWVTLTCGRFKLERAGLNGSDYTAPKGPKPGSPTYTISGALLAKVLSGPLYAVGADETKAMLTQLVVEVEDDAIESLATDGHRAVICRCDIAEGFDFRGKLQLLRHGAARLAKMASHSMEWTIDVGKDGSTNKPSLRVSSGNTTMILAQHSLTPPPIRRVVPAEYLGTCTVDAGEISRLVDTLKASLPISANAHFVIGADGLSGEAYDDKSNDRRAGGTIDVADFDGSPIDIHLHALYLADAISALGGNERFMIGWRTGMDPVVLCGPGSRHVIMPMDPSKLKK